MRACLCTPVEDADLRAAVRPGQPAVHTVPVADPDDPSQPHPLGLRALEERLLLEALPDPAYGPYLDRLLDLLVVRLGGTREYHLSQLAAWPVVEVEVWSPPMEPSP